MATSAVYIGTGDFDPVANILHWDERCKALFGITSNVPITNESSFLAGMHPDDQDRAATAVTAALRLDGDGQYDLEY